MKVLLMSLLLAWQTLASTEDYKTCWFYKESPKPCIDFDRTSFCQVCRGERTCGYSMSGLNEKLCKVYLEGKRCTTLKSIDRGWCEVIKNGKTCSQAFTIIPEDCLLDRRPFRHEKWL